MFAKLRSRLSYANVTATLALFLALGTGGAYAANTVFSTDIVDGQVKTVDLGDAAVTERKLDAGAVTSDKFRDNNLKSRDVLDNTLTGADIATGAVRTDELANGQVQAEDLAPGVAPGAIGARAWGHVDTGGNLLRSKNVSGITSPLPGLYCIDPGSGINPDTAVMVVGEVLLGGATSDGLNDVSHAVWNPRDPSVPHQCPPTTMQVWTFIGDGSPPSGSGGGFDVFGPPGSAQPFTFAIP
jgi:hypothetical protein